VTHEPFEASFPLKEVAEALVRPELSVNRTLKGDVQLILDVQMAQPANPTVPIREGMLVHPKTGRAQPKSYKSLNGVVGGNKTEVTWLRDLKPGSIFHPSQPVRGSSPGFSRRRPPPSIGLSECLNY